MAKSNYTMMTKLTGQLFFINAVVTVTAIVTIQGFSHLVAEDSTTGFSFTVVQAVVLCIFLTSVSLFLCYRTIIKPLRGVIINMTGKIEGGEVELPLVCEGHNELSSLDLLHNKLLDELALRKNQLAQVQVVLKESELKFRSITDSALDPVFMLDHEGDISYWNEAAREMFGYRSEEVVGCPFHDVLVHEKERSCLQKEMESLVKEHRTRSVNEPLELPAQKKDGSVLPVEVMISTITIDQQVSVIGIIRDLSNRKEAEKELEESRWRLELALKTIDAGLWDWNLDTGKLYFNSRYLSMLGYKEGEIENDVSHHQRLLHPDDQPALERTMADLLAGKQTDYRLEQRYRKKDGDWLWLLCMGKVVEKDDAGNPSRMIGTHMDIHKSKMAEIGVQEYQENLEQMVFDRTRKLEETHAELINKAIEAGRSQLSAMILHNIGNAVTPVKVQIEEMKADSFSKMISYLKKCYQELETHLDDLSTFVTSDERGIEIFRFTGELIENLEDRRSQQKEKIVRIDGAISYISEILALQQTYAAHETDSRQLVNLNLLLEDALRMQISALDKRDIRVVKQLTPDLPKLTINKNRLVQVIVNIIKNGYEAIDDLNLDKDHSLTIRTFPEKDRVGFEIADTGVGVESEQIPSLFEFGKSRKGSSGIGLYYCKVFVEQNGGEMVFTSTGKGNGATVKVLFQPTRAS